MPIHKSAEPDSFAVYRDFAERDTLIEEQPETCYTAAHYENAPSLHGGASGNCRGWSRFIDAAEW